jgi:hypothetical protein
MASAADLIAHVAADLTGCEVARGAPGTAVVAPRDGTPPFRLAVRAERRRLLHLQTLLVHVDGPRVEEPRLDATHADGPGVDGARVAGSSDGTATTARLVFHHTGQVRRTGLTAVVRPVGRRRRWSGETPPPVAAMRDRLLADGELERVSLPLDFTHFEVAVVDGAWRATLELMGASHIRTTLPPSSRYVRLHPDQRDALLATVAVLHARLPGTTPRVERAPATPTAPTATPATDPRPVAAPQTAGVPSPRPDHLPRRPT